MTKHLHTAGAVLLLALAALVVLEARSFGFPDGALTELERAQRPLYYGFAAASGLCAVLLLLLPTRARYVWAAYVVIVAGVVLVDRHLAASLPGGGGG